ncbi:MAG: hypothetical protein HC933_05545 [Pleurocapsa sp. SU_196_0]|nr:hypothetical protein [Pleurocapsa sp. SU_196_0]
MLSLAFQHLKSALLATGWQEREIVQVVREGTELPRAPVAYINPAFDMGKLERDPSLIKRTASHSTRQLFVGWHGVQLRVQHLTPQRLEGNVQALLEWLFDHKVGTGLNGSQVVFDDRIGVSYFDETGQYVGESGVLLTFNAILLVARSTALLTRSPEIESAEFEP